MSVNDYRNNVIEVLRLIASRDEQLSYERDVPIANVPAELLCGWFDDMYHPDSELFHEAFNQGERDRMAQFHSFFDARADQLPDSLEEMHKNDLWLEVMGEAQSVLKDLGWEYRG